MPLMSLNPLHSNRHKEDVKKGIEKQSAKKQWRMML